MSELPPSEPFVPVPTDAAATTHCSATDYDRLYAASIADPDAFWAEQAKRIDWIKAPTKIVGWSFDPVDIKWYEDGILNLCFNCVDRHLPERADQVALIWEADEPGVTKRLPQSSIRPRSASGEKPPKTTLWTAPIRAQASIATTTSGIIGR